MSRIRIEIKTSIGRFGEKGGYIMKEEMQKKLFYKIVLVTFFLAQCTFNLLIQSMLRQGLNRGQILLALTYKLKFEF